MQNVRWPAWVERFKSWVQLLLTYTTVRERVLLGMLALALVGSIVWSVVGLIQRNTVLIPETGGSYVEAAAGQPRHLNPVLAGGNEVDLDINNLVYSSLFDLNRDLELEGDLANGFTVSNDGRTYTVTLRDDVRWHDGERLTSEDVVFTVRSIQTPDYGSPLASSFQGVEVEAPDESTVIFRLREPYAPFINNLTVGIVPKHVWEGVAPQNAALAEQVLRPVGSGPFAFAELTTRRRTGEVTSLRLVRNGSYHGQVPYLDEFNFVFFPTPEEAVTALMDGRADGVGFLPLSLLNRVENRSSLAVHRLLLPQYFGLFLNETKNEILNDAGVRAALTLATDRSAIVSGALNGEAEVVYIPIPPTIIDASEEIDEPVVNPEAARQNLTDAGWVDTNDDGVREKDGVELRLVIATTDWPEYVRTAELIQEQWAQIGVAVDIESYGAGTIQQTVVNPRDYEVLLYGEVLAVDPDPYPFWHSTQTRNPGLNLSLFRDEQTDTLLEEARKLLDREERYQKYVEFQQRFLDLNPAIILYQPYYLFAQHKDVRGSSIEHINLPYSRFNDVEGWHVNVKRVWE